MAGHCTERLSLERLGHGHAAELSALLGDPRVAVTLGGAPEPERVRTLCAESEDHWARRGFGLWLARDRVAGGAPAVCVGRGGLHRLVLEGRDEVEVAWAIASARWGEGLATELGAAALAVAARHGLASVIALTLPHNRPSRRVMEKLGFAYEGAAVHAGLDHVLYRRALAPPGR